MTEKEKLEAYKRALHRLDALITGPIDRKRPLRAELRKVREDIAKCTPIDELITNPTDMLN